MNQVQIVKERRKLNVLLALIFFSLLLWVGIEVKDEVERVYRANQPLKAKRIDIKRDANTIELRKQGNQWQVTSPYQSKASQTVVNALLERVKRGCRIFNDIPSRMPEMYGQIIIDGDIYQVGELNSATNEIYVLHDKDWLLCDKLLVSMALSPAINFIDKQLYEGELRAIVGDFGRLTDFAGVDLSVMEIAPAEVDKLPKNMISKLKFIGDNERDYQTFLSEDMKHLLLFDKEKSVLYVVASHPKLKSILGL